jgi:LCP family protein required for cell wall assembly
VLLVLAGLVRLGVAIHEILPRAGVGDLLALANPAGPFGAVARDVDYNRRVNILLLAHGGAGGDNPDFTDTMIVLSIRPATHAATAIALPRYLWVTIPAGVHGDVQGKLYATYALGAEAGTDFLKPQWRGVTGPGDLAAATIGATIGEPIPFWIAVDSNAFTALIDDVGGIQINIPSALDDPTYPVGDEGRTTHIHFDAGQQTLNGTRALEYARSRLSTSDADRQRRQELVLVAILQSLRSPRWSVGAFWSLGPLQSGVRTNLEPDDIRAIAQLMGGVHERDVARYTLDDSGLLESQPLGPAEIEVPRDGTYAAVRAYVAARLP